MRLIYIYEDEKCILAKSKYRNVCRNKVLTSHNGLGAEELGTGAVSGTISIHQTLLLLTANLLIIGVSEESIRTGTLGFVTSGGALSVPTTDDWASTSIFTLEESVFSADTGVQITTVNIVATARLLDTETVLTTVERRTLRVVLTLADAAPSVTQLVVQAVSGGLTGRGADPEAAEHSTGTLLLVGAESQLGAALGGLSSEAGQTEAPGHMVDGPAVGVLAAHVEEAAHVDTLVPHAGSLPGTLDVGDALQLDTPHCRVPVGARRAGAHRPVVGRGTDGVRSTGAGNIAGVLALSVDTTG